MPNLTQLDLFGTNEIINQTNSTIKQTADYLNISEIRYLLEAAEDIRSFSSSFDLHPTEIDICVDFPLRSILFEYLARLQELAHQNWLLKNTNQLNYLGIYGSEEWLPQIFEKYACNLILFTYNCWSEATQTSCDGGIDGLVYSSWKKNVVLGIQTKLYSNSVPISHIREFYGALVTSSPKIVNGLFFTSSPSLPKPPKSNEIKIFYLDKEGLSSIMNLVEVAAEWFTTYAELCINPLGADEDFYEVAARLINIRNRIDDILKLSSLLPVRKENNLPNSCIEKWANKDTSELL